MYDTLTSSDSEQAGETTFKYELTFPTVQLWPTRSFSAEPVSSTAHFSVVDKHPWHDHLTVVAVVLPRRLSSVMDFAFLFVSSSISMTAFTISPLLEPFSLNSGLGIACNVYYTW